MSDVIFITPNFGGLVREEPVGTLLLTTILRQSGISTDILQFHHFGDVRFFDHFVQSAIEQVAAAHPCIVSFYTRCDTYHISLKLAQQIKKHQPETYIILGGPQSDLSCEETLCAIPFVDYICCGEGETTVVPFFSSLLSGTPDLTVPGLAFRSNNGIVKNPRPELIKNLDTLPTIDYSTFKFSADKQKSKLRSLFPIDVGRGCPFGCTYCSTKTFWGRKYRLKSAERIIEEIKTAHQQFGISNFVFEHDMFTLDREKVIRVCQMLKEIGFPVRWRCSARLDCLDNQLVDIMADAGLDVLFVGIETGSPRMQRLIRKNLNLDNVPEKLQYIAEKGISVTASFIFGFPHETEDDFSQTISLMVKLCRLPKITVQHHLCAFFSGTELTDQYISSTSRSTLISDATGEFAVKDCEDIISAHPLLFPHFFEFKTDLREKAKYFPQFFDCWNFMRPIYEYIAERYYNSRLFDMLVDFSKRNAQGLRSGAHWLELLNEDHFIDTYTEDENYPILKEASRFLFWKEQASHGDTEVFSYDMKALLNGASITELAKTKTIISLAKNQVGKTVLSFYKTSATSV